MEIFAAALIGGVIGWLIGRAGRSPVDKQLATPAPDQSPVDRLNRKLTKRQQRILQSLPEDSPRPTLDDLIAEEADRLGVDEIDANREIPTPIRLAVFKRDLGEEPPPDIASYMYEVRPGAREPYVFEDVRLVRRTETD